MAMESWKVFAPLVALNGILANSFELFWTKPLPLEANEDSDDESCLRSDLTADDVENAAANLDNLLSVANKIVATKIIDRSVTILAMFKIVQFKLFNQVYFKRAEDVGYFC